MDKQANIALKPVQAEMMRVHVQRLQKAQAAIETAQKILENEQENASLFVAYCSAELGAGDGYVFEQSSMSFVPRKEGEAG